MKKLNRNSIARLCIDLGVLAISFIAAFLVRLDFAFDMHWLKLMMLHLPAAVFFGALSLRLAGITKSAWRFVSLHDARNIAIALTLAQIPFVIEHIVLSTGNISSATARIYLVPWGVIVINLCLSILGCMGVRVVRRMIFESELLSRHHRTLPIAPTRTIIIGGGSCAKNVLDSVRVHPELGLEPVGIISDAAEDAGRTIANVPVLGKVDDLASIAVDHEIQQAVIIEPADDSGIIRKIFDICSQIPIKTRIVPRMNDILSGAVDIGQMREVSVEDLLHRDPVKLDKEEISKFLHGRRILISGAGGSIGSEMCRQVLVFEPAELILLERCELFLYEIERELKAKAPNLRIIPELADICDKSRIEEIYAQHKPEVVFHAAAYKHVPMLEYNPGESIRNNVEGTAIMADCAQEHGAAAFVMISTDKAVNPTSIMGTSKRIAELYIQGMSSLGSTRFCAVRFGNVLGSTGSVLPLFKKQIASGGPLTVTHPEMVRYFMTIPEAAQLVMQAGTMAHSGEIFVLDMGNPVKIVQLARDVMRLNGKTEKDIPIVFTGIRPGEKLFEELSFNAEHMAHTDHPKIYVGKLKSVDLSWIREQITTLHPLRDSKDNDAVRAAMKRLVPEMQEPAKD